MSDRPRLRRKDPDREGPVRHWSNLYQTAAARVPATPSANGAAMPLEANELTPEAAVLQPASASAAAVPGPVGDEARAEIEGAYRVVDEHLQEGRRAAEALSPDKGAKAPGAYPGAAGVTLAAESIQEMVTQGIRFYSSLAPLWASILNSIANTANAANPTSTVAPAAPPLSPPPLARNASTMVAAPFTIELASARMTRVTIDLLPHANATRFTTGGLHAIEADRPPLKDITFVTDSHLPPLVRIRVPDSQPAGIYNGVIADAVSGDPCGTITLRIEG